MTVLLNAEALRESIRTVLGQPDDERVVAVAFVGSNPLEWLPHPKGLKIYCWPHAGATHPDGIDKLIKSGAHVYFVDRLHAKIYWSRKGGAVIGSANLSQNGLGDGGLFEAGVQLAPGALQIESVLEYLENDALSMDDACFPAELEKLRRAHVAYMQRNNSIHATGEKPSETPQLRTFGEWLEMAHRPQWQLGLWTHYSEPPEDTVNAFKEAYPGETFSNWRGGDDPAELQSLVPTLDCSYRKNDWGIKMRPSPFWWYPEDMFVTTNPDWQDCENVWFARENIPDGCSVPFDPSEKRFLTALDKAVHELADRTEGLKGPISQEFTKLLAEWYRRVR